MSKISPVEGDGEEVKVESEGTIECLKLIPQKRKTTGTRLKDLTSNKLLTRLPILLAQIKAENKSDKLKKWNLMY